MCAEAFVDCWQRHQQLRPFGASKGVLFAASSSSFLPYLVACFLRWTLRPGLIRLPPSLSRQGQQAMLDLDLARHLHLFLPRRRGHSFCGHLVMLYVRIVFLPYVPLVVLIQNVATCCENANGSSGAVGLEQCLRARAPDGTKSRVGPASDPCNSNGEEGESHHKHEKGVTLGLRFVASIVFPLC